MNTRRAIKFGLPALAAMIIMVCLVIGRLLDSPELSWDQFLQEVATKISQSG